MYCQIDRCIAPIDRCIVPIDYSIYISGFLKVKISDSSQKIRLNKAGGNKANAQHQYCKYGCGRKQLGFSTFF